MILAVKGLAVVVGVVAVPGGIGAAFALTGKPAACADHEIQTSEAARLALTSQWDDFKAEAAAGTASVAFSEPEVMSRAVKWIADESVDLENVQVYLCEEGYAEATATFTGAGPSIDFLARGTLDLTGDRPAVDVSEVKVGNLPGFVPLATILNFLPEDVKELDITEVKLTGIDFSDRKVTLTGVK